MGAWSDARIAIARFMAPLFAWMALGWLLYPYAAEYLADATGESMVISEIKAFSLVAMVACLATSFIALGYAILTRNHVDDSATALAVTCPYCGARMEGAPQHCAVCARPLRKA